MFIDDASGDGKAEAGPGFLGGKERVKEAGLDFARDPFAGVDDLENDGWGGFFGGRHEGAAGVEGDGAIMTDAFGGILNEVNEDLFELLGIDADPEGAGGREMELDGVFLELSRQETFDPGEKVGGEDGDGAGFGGACEMEHFAHDAIEALDFLVDDGGVFVFGGAADEGAFETVEAHIDGGERIANLVGDPGGEGAEGSEFFLAFDDGLAFDELSAERGDFDAIDQIGGSNAEDEDEDDQGDEEALGAAEGLV